MLSHPVHFNFCCRVIKFQLTFSVPSVGGGNASSGLQGDKKNISDIIFTGNFKQQIFSYSKTNPH
jgi:hypothetical protein